jgi:hypothetical protein
MVVGAGISISLAGHYRKMALPFIANQSIEAQVEQLLNNSIYLLSLSFCPMSDDGI